MKYTTGQENALKGIRKWLNDGRGPQVKYLAGYAGTGKTTIAKEIAKLCTTHFCAYTGKAALVLREKGCDGATTVHSLIYTPITQYECPKCKAISFEDGKCREVLCSPTKLVAHVRYRLRRREFDNFTGETKQSKIWDIVDNDGLIVVDECSMLANELVDDLLSFGTRVLVIGDPFQLPPMQGTSRFGNEYHWLLDETRRQESDSGVLRLATDIRQNGYMSRNNAYGNDVEILPRSKYKLAERWPQTEQLLVGTNALRRGMNANIRSMLGRAGETVPELPTADDVLVCLRNNHKTGLVNGQQWEVIEARGDCRVLTITMTQLDSPDAAGIAVKADPKIFLGEAEATFKHPDVECFDYGYALTVHKSQGSQWKHVTIFDESSAFRENRLRWLYTAVTRACKQVVVVV